MGEEESDEEKEEEVNLIEIKEDNEEEKKNEMKIEISIKRNDYEISKEEAILDTGSSASIIGEQKVIELGIQEEITPTSIKMTNASQMEMKITGVIKIKMKDNNDKSQIYSEISVIVTPEIQKKILISSGDQKELGVLHPSYPNINYNNINLNWETEEEEVQRNQVPKEELSVTLSNKNRKVMFKKKQERLDMKRRDREEEEEYTHAAAKEEE